MKPRTADPTPPEHGGTAPACAAVSLLAARALIQEAERLLSGTDLTPLVGSACDRLREAGRLLTDEAEAVVQSAQRTGETMSKGSA